MDIVNQQDTIPFTTVDGSTIRELLAHRNSAIRKQSLAEARLEAGSATTPHHHDVTEEIYYILTGTAAMTLGEETREVGPGDAIAIPPGKRHNGAALKEVSRQFGPLRDRREPITVQAIRQILKRCGIPCR